MYYIINFENGGYALISANKDYTPILAYSDSGYFDYCSAKLSGFSVWNDEIIENVKHADSAPLETRKNNRAAWSTFLKKYKKSDIAKSKSRMIYEDDEEEAKIQQQIYEWQLAGYTIYTVADYKENYIYLPTLSTAEEAKLNEIYNMDYDTEKMAYPKDYNYVLYIDKYNINIDIPGLLSTSWHQDAPYNNAVEYYYSNGTRLPLGCTAVALGQILKYYAEIPGYNFANMPNVTTTANSDISNFLYDVANKIGIRYVFGDTSATITQVMTAIGDYGYSYDLVNHNYSYVTNSLLDGCPVIMFGTDSNLGGHAWVCDGVQYG